MMQEMMTGLEKFIGIPYVPMGKDFNGVDCLGIVELYYKEFNLTHGEKMPEYDYDGEFTLSKMKKYDKEVKAFAANKKALYRIEDIQKNDLICFSVRGKFIDHLAVALGYGKFLHMFYKEAKSSITHFSRDWTPKFKYAVRF